MGRQHQISVVCGLRCAWLHAVHILARPDRLHDGEGQAYVNCGRRPTQRRFVRLLALTSWRLPLIAQPCAEKESGFEFSVERGGNHAGNAVRDTLARVMLSMRIDYHCRRGRMIQNRAGLERCNHDPEVKDLAVCLDHASVLRSLPAWQFVRSLRLARLVDRRWHFRIARRAFRRRLGRIAWARWWYFRGFDWHLDRHFADAAGVNVMRIVGHDSLRYCTRMTVHMPRRSDAPRTPARALSGADRAVRIGASLNDSAQERLQAICNAFLPIADFLALS